MTPDTQRDGVALALARISCPLCHGYGQHSKAGNGERGIVTCQCALRAVFRACLAGYRLQSELMAMGASCTTLEPGNGLGFMAGNKSAEYCADFGLVARRALDAAEWNIFTKHLIAERPFYECCSIVGPNDKKYFYDSVYKVMRKLGQAFLDEGLYPLHEYFGSHSISAWQVARGHTAMAPIKQALRIAWQNRGIGHPLPEQRHAA
jgi:hypothetical protein